MAADGQGKTEFTGQGGGAVDGLTPPTMQYSDERTQIGSASPMKTQIASPKTQITAGADERTQMGTGLATGLHSAPPGGSSSPGRSGVSATIAGEMETIASDIPEQDLSQELLLRDAPRMSMGGREYPSLNGIPLRTKLGQGGMGAVYYGVHPRLRSEVAVKVLPFHLAAQDPQMIQRFFREAQIAARVRSPHLVNVMDVNEEAGLFFLVMEFVPGCTAGQYMKHVIEVGKDQGVMGLTEIDALDIMIASTAGLHAAHVNGIIHRDLKPDNIMIPYKSRANKVYDLVHSKLMDLGLARSEEGSQSLTGAQSAMGTPGYMAPEQALDAKTADKRSDIFGMGATMYALLTGRPPFKGDAIMKVLMATMHEPHEPITTPRPDVSQATSELLDRCLDKKPENRPADAHALLKMLRQVRRQVAPNRDEDGEVDEGPVGPGIAASGGTPSHPTVQGAKTQVGGQKTMVTGPGGKTVAVDAPPKSKGMLYVAGGAVALLIAGGVGFAMMGKKPEEPKVVKAEPVEAPDPSGEKRAKDLNMGGGYADFAKSMAQAGNMDSAKDFLQKALDVNKALKDDGLKKKTDEVQNIIDRSANKDKFDKQMKSIDENLAKGAYDKAIEVIIASKPLAEKLGKDELTLLNGKETAITGKLVADQNKKRYDDKFKTLPPLEPLEKSDPEKALVILDELDKLQPGDAELKSLRTKYTNQKDLKDRTAKHDALLKSIPEFENSGRFEKAYEAAESARQLLGSKKAEDEAARLLGKLGAQKIAEQEQKRKQQIEERFNKLVGDIRKSNEAKDFDQSDLSIAEALRLKPQDKIILELQAVSKKGQEEKAASAAEQKKRKVFEDSIKEVDQILGINGDLEAADKLMAAAKVAYPGDKMLAERDTKIKAQREARRIQKEYDDAVEKADVAFKAKDYDNAEKYADAAIKLVPSATKPNTMKKLIVDKRDELKAAAELERKELAAKKQKIAGIMTDAQKLEASNDFEGALKKYEEIPGILADHKDHLPAVQKAKEGQAKLVAAMEAAATSIGTQLAGGKLDDAIAEATKAAKSFPARKDIAELKTAAEGLKAIEEQATSSVTLAQKTLGELITPLDGRGTTERQVLDSKIAALKAISKETLAKLAKPGAVKTAGAIVADAEKQRKALASDANDMLLRLKEIARQPKSRPVERPTERPRQNPGEKDPFEGGGGGGKKGGGGAGEADPFN